MAHNFKYVKDYNGIHNPMIQIDANEAVKQGDALVLTSDKTEVDRADDAAEAIHGVASHAAAQDAVINVYPSSDSAVFIVPTVTTGYTDATHRNTFCDINTFTSGAMAVLPGTTGNVQVQLLGLVEGETDGLAGNLVYVKFNLRSGQGA
jgi:hypothetical protein